MDIDPIRSRASITSDGYLSNLLRMGRSMCPRTQYTHLTTIGGTGPCGPMRIIFDSVIKSWYINQNIKFGVNRTFYVPKNTVCRFDYYWRYRTMWTDEHNFS